MNNNKNQENDIDIEGLIAQIQDSDLFNIVIEGKDDKLVYDEFEDIYGLTEPLVSVLEVGGRNNVLTIFEALKDTSHINKTVFIVDQDQWVLTGIEQKYNHPNIICTHGYSFENDVFIDGELAQDMQKKNPDILAVKLPILLKWYALEVNRIQNGFAPKKLTLDISNLFNCIDEYTTPDAHETFPSETFENLNTDYPKLMRGKTLLKFYTSIMNQRENCNSNTYSTIATIESVCKHKGTHLNRIFSEVDNLYKRLTA